MDWDRQHAAPALALPPQALDDARRNAIRTLAVSVEHLGHILREQGKAECVTAYEEDYDLSPRIGDQHGAAVAAFYLGRAYTDLPALRDLVQAERWYRHSLEMHEEHHRHDRAQCLVALGNVAWERFKEAQAAAPTPPPISGEGPREGEELLRHLNAALGFYLQALDLLPPNAVDDLAVTHNQLGIIYYEAGDLDRALPHYREAIRYFEEAGAIYNAAQASFNVALALARVGRLADAREYAHAALRNFETYGEGAREGIQKTRGLIAAIEQAMIET